jgi:hypothetical protein
MFLYFGRQKVKVENMLFWKIYYVTLCEQMPFSVYMYTSYQMLASDYQLSISSKLILSENKCFNIQHQPYAVGTTGSCVFAPKVTLIMQIQTHHSGNWFIKRIGSDEIKWIYLRGQIKFDTKYVSIHILRSLLLPSKFLISVEQHEWTLTYTYQHLFVITWHIWNGLFHWLIETQSWAGSQYRPIKRRLTTGAEYVSWLQKYYNGSVINRTECLL